MAQKATRKGTVAAIDMVPSKENEKGVKKTSTVAKKGNGAIKRERKGCVETKQPRGPLAKVAAVPSNENGKGVLQKIATRGTIKRKQKGCHAKRRQPPRAPSPNCKVLPSNENRKQTGCFERETKGPMAKPRRSHPLRSPARGFERFAGEALPGPRAVDLGAHGGGEPGDRLPMAAWSKGNGSEDAPGGVPPTMAEAPRSLLLFGGLGTRVFVGNSKPKRVQSTSCESHGALI